MIEIALAALDYGDCTHIFAEPCHSHPSDCPACAARKKLEELVEGPSAEINPNART